VHAASAIAAARSKPVIHARLCSGAIVLAATLLLVPPAPAQVPSLAELATRNVTRVGATEEPWLVAEVARELARIAGRPSTGITAVALPPGPMGPVFEVRANGAAVVRIAVPSLIWDPAVYAPLATAWLPARGATDGAGGGTPSTLAVLTTPTTAAMLDEDRRLAARLAAAPASAEAHEDAALLIATFALREAAGGFSDVRPALSRMAARLGAATALRGTGPRSPSGRMAAIALSALCGRQAGAIAGIELAMKGTPDDAERAWLRALRLRATGDYRTAEGASLTLLEQLECGRAFRQRVGDHRLAAWLRATAPADVIDWSRLALDGAVSVAAVQDFAREGSVGEELAEAGRIWAAFHEGRSTPERVVADVAAPGEDVRAHVLGWADWAPFLERHIAARLAARGAWSTTVGHPLEAGELADIRRRFAPLPLLPLVLVEMGTAAEREAARTAARALFDGAPHRITANRWNALVTPPGAARSATAFPMAETWFYPWVPTGTAYDTDERSLRPKRELAASMREVQAMHERAPYRHWPGWLLVWRRMPDPQKPGLAAVREALGPILEYDVDAVQRVYNELDLTDAEYEATARTLCRIDADRCDTLAGWLLAHGRDAEAAATFVAWFRASQDRVRASAGVRWLVRYLHAQGQAEAAEAIADDAAETYSAGGLLTRAEQFERRGEAALAEQVYTAAVERYGASMRDDLGGFYLRRARVAGDTALERRGLELLAAVFPTGFEPPPTDGPPPDGVLLPRARPRLEAVGLRDGDLIVAVDGVRVRHTGQFAAALRLRDEEDMDLVVWRGAAYRSLHVRLPQRWVGETTRTHRAGPRRP
jgi:hypothetical protein